MDRITFKISVLGIIIGVGASLFSCKGKVSQSGDGANPPIVLQTEDNQGVFKGIFGISEIEIAPSPAKACAYAFPKKEQLVDYSVSPKGSLVAALTEHDGRYDLKFWTIGATDISNGCAMPKNFKAKTVVWHPRGYALFVLGEENAESCIYRIENSNAEWTTERIFSSKQTLEKMIFCPQPFSTHYENGKSFYSYRLFLGMDNGDKTYRVVSITERGERFYQVAGPEKTQTKLEEYAGGQLPVSAMQSSWALPAAFHPSGYQFLWQDKQLDLYVAAYEGYWDKSTPLKLPLKNKDAIIPTPNGLGIISWQKNTPGIEMYLIPDKSSSKQLGDYRFETAPVAVPDGKGIVGKTVKNGISALQYTPVNIPLPNVLNAWLFIKSAEELAMFQKNNGLFRPTRHQQLYELYETENYYSSDIQARPYMVTTDIFWELFAAAYQGIFIIKEREQAIPEFWRFINEADEYFKANHPASKWNIVFTALKDLAANRATNEETARIIHETDDFSEVTQKQYAYSDLKPRGHYTSSPEMSLYFKAFRYFTTILSEPPEQEVLKELDRLPASITRYAELWINSYADFIAPSRSALVWSNLKTAVPPYCLYPKEETAIFPLSWGFDNEILFNTVYHEIIPLDLRVQGPPDQNGLAPRRLLPSAVDIAAVMGNGLADRLMTEEYAQYPPLRKAIANLRSNYQTHADADDIKNNLYNQWINAMAVQWADSVQPATDDGVAIWQVKRLQTGLATWATLRHATVLVNERIAAESGEGGYEEMLMKTPRGCVEPDPYTFKAIADLFQKLSETASQLKSEAVDKQAVYSGLNKRLEEALQETLLFAEMAEKDRKGELLSNEECEKILYVARVAEHLFLIFRSLENKEYGLSIPEPMAKIADVAQSDKSKFSTGSGSFSYLMTAVGNPLEWNFLVPYYGRYQIVKGSIYSYYEFESPELLNDEEWRLRINKQAVLPWIQPYMSAQTLSGATTGY